MHRLGFIAYILKLFSLFDGNYWLCLMNIYVESFRYFFKTGVETVANKLAPCLVFVSFRFEPHCGKLKLKSTAAGQGL